MRQERRDRRRNTGDSGHETVYMRHEPGDMRHETVYVRQEI